MATIRLGGEDQLQRLTDNIKLLSTIKKGKYLRAVTETPDEHFLMSINRDADDYKFNLNRFKCIVQYSINASSLNDYIKGFGDYPYYERDNMQCQLKVKTVDNSNWQIISTSERSVFKTPSMTESTRYRDGLATFVVDAQLVGTWQTFTYASDYGVPYKYVPSTITLGGWTNSGGWNEDYEAREKISGNITDISLNFFIYVKGNGEPTKTLALPMGDGGIKYQLFLYGVQDKLVKIN